MTSIAGPALPQWSEEEAATAGFLTLEFPTLGLVEGARFAVEFFDEVVRQFEAGGSWSAKLYELSFDDRTITSGSYRERRRARRKKKPTKTLKQKIIAGLVAAGVFFGAYQGLKEFSNDVQAAVTKVQDAWKAKHPEIPVNPTIEPAKKELNEKSPEDPQRPNSSD